VTTQAEAGVGDLLRPLAPEVLGSLVRRYGHFDLAEDAVQEALLAAALQWPEQGVPEHPRGWLITVAARRLTDELRSDRARRQREERAAAQVPADELVESPPYQLQAAIAAVHAEAARAEDTDWPQIVALYELLERISPNPMITLNHAVAVAMARGPRAGLDLLRALEGDRRVAEHHRLHAVRAHLLEMAGDREAARDGYLRAARRATSLPERRYLETRAAQLGDNE
jgi:predicted RNA polymerase sigma factor